MMIKKSVCIALHKKVLVKFPDADVMIDERIAPLIDLIQKLGFFTGDSCEEVEPGVACIEFPIQCHATASLNLLAQYPDESERVPICDTLYGRIMGCCNPKCYWEYAVLPFNWAVRHDSKGGRCQEYSTGPAALTLRVWIRFPISDIPLIKDRLTEVVEVIPNEARSELCHQLVEKGSGFTK